MITHKKWKYHSRSKRNGKGSKRNGKGSKKRSVNKYYGVKPVGKDWNQVKEGPRPQLLPRSGSPQIQPRPWGTTKINISTRP